MTESEHGVSFRARALAQAHPLSETAHSYRESVIAVERETQPMREFADWAATAFLVGYCVRRVEEVDAADVSEVIFGVMVDDSQQLASLAARIADDLRSGRPSGTELLDPTEIEAVLDEIISSEIQKRSEHWRSHVDDDDWAMFEDYVAWWVVHGYSLRAAERRAMITE